MKKDRFEILFEKMNRKFDLVLKSQESLRQDIRKAMQDIGEKIDGNTTLLRNLNLKLDDRGYRV